MLSIRRLVAILAIVFMALVWVVQSPDDIDEDANKPWDIVVAPNSTDTVATTASPREEQPANDDALDKAYKIMSIVISGAILLVICIAAIVAVKRGVPLDLENGPFAAPIRILQQLRGRIDAFQERRAIRNLR